MVALLLLSSSSSSLLLLLSLFLLLWMLMPSMLPGSCGRRRRRAARRWTPSTEGLRRQHHGMPGPEKVAVRRGVGFRRRDRRIVVVTETDDVVLGFAADGVFVA